MTQVRQIRTEDFMGHKFVDIVLPESGIVLVTGQNGSGKSTVVEAVAVGLWGKTIRGTAWADNTPSKVNIRTNRLEVSRVSDSRSKTLTIKVQGESPVEYPAVNKGQEVITGIIGNLQQWKRTSTFSSQDIVSFSRATDAERKRLLETMLGIDQIDVGLSRCRELLNNGRKSLTNVENKIELLKVELAASKDRISDLESTSTEAPRYSNNEHEHTKRCLQEAREDLEIMTRERQKLHDEVAFLKQQIGTLKAQIDNVETLDICPTCNQIVPIEIKTKVRNENTKAINKMITNLRETKAKGRATVIELNNLNDEVQNLHVELRDHSVKQNIFELWSIENETRQEKLRSIDEKIQELRKQLMDFEDAESALVVNVGELSAVDNVLGLQGVRAKLTADAIAGLECVANSWLTRLMPGVSIRINTETELKSGRTTDKISLTFDGLNHSNGYPGCSGGERRRIDVALLLGLAELQATDVNGTLFFDEVFDTLDKEGVAALSSALEELSEDRCIVIITHSENVLEGINACTRLHFYDGNVQHLNNWEE